MNYIVLHVPTQELIYADFNNKTDLAHNPNQFKIWASQGPVLDCTIIRADTAAAVTDDTRLDQQH